MSEVKDSTEEVFEACSGADVNSVTRVCAGGKSATRASAQGLQLVLEDVEPYYGNTIIDSAKCVAGCCCSEYAVFAMSAFYHRRFPSFNCFTGTGTMSACLTTTYSCV